MPDTLSRNIGKPSTLKENRGWRKPQTTKLDVDLQTLDGNIALHR